MKRMKPKADQASVRLRELLRTMPKYLKQLLGAGSSSAGATGLRGTSRCCTS